MRLQWKLLLENNTSQKFRQYIQSDYLNDSQYFLNDEYSKYSLLSLKRYFESNENSDITIITINGEKCNAHLDILNAHTKFFSTCFQNSWSESENNTIHLDCDYLTLLSVLKYFYLGETNSIPPDLLLPCITLSHQLDSISLTSILERLIVDYIDSDNVCSILALANTYNLHFLKERCLITAIHNLEKIKELEYFTYLSESTRKALENLTHSYNQSKSLYGDTFKYLKELLSMINDSIKESEEVYQTSYLRNSEEIQKCEGRLTYWGIHFDSTNLDINSYTINPRLRELIEWRIRLYKVELTLQTQKIQIDQRREFYQKQKFSSDIFYVS